MHKTMLLLIAALAMWVVSVLSLFNRPLNVFLTITAFVAAILVTLTYIADRRAKR